MKKKAVSVYYLFQGEGNSELYYENINN